MLARLQQGFVVAALCFSALWAALAIVFGRPSWVAMGAALVALGYLFLLGFEFLLLFKSYATASSERPRGLELLVAYLREVPCALTVFTWRQPFAHGNHKDSSGLRGGTRRGLVLVHGMFCNRGFWNPWLRRLEASGIPFAAVTLEPVFGSIDDYSKQIDTAVQRVALTTGYAPVVVGHSMGGLAIRAWLASGPEVPAPAHHVVTIGTPHRGAFLAEHSYVCNGRQMRRHSAWLHELSRRESAMPPVPTTCFWSRCDNIVFPTESATLPGASNRELKAQPHMRMAFHPDVFESVIRLLDPSEAPAPTPAAAAASSNPAED